MTEEYQPQPKTEEVSWNLSYKVVEHLATKLSAISSYLFFGQLNECYRSLNEIKIWINHHFTPEERHVAKRFREVADKYFIAMGKILARHDNCEEEVLEMREGDVKRYCFYKSRLTKLLEKYMEFVFEMLDKYGYLIPLKEDKTSIN